jgi:hypothetical protein
VLGGGGVVVRYGVLCEFCYCIVWCTSTVCCVVPFGSGVWCATINVCCGALQCVCVVRYGGGVLCGLRYGVLCVRYSVLCGALRCICQWCTCVGNGALYSVCGARYSVLCGAPQCIV